MADAEERRQREGINNSDNTKRKDRTRSSRDGESNRMADDDDEGLRLIGRIRLPDDEVASLGYDADGRRPTGGFWADPDWVYCRDGKWRPVESIEHADEQDLDGTTESRNVEVADGSAAWLERVRTAGPLVSWNEIQGPKPSRGGMLKAYGNAIVAPLAAEFIATVMEVLGIPGNKREKDV